ncbi:MAG: biopolymer transporter ExbD [Phycisphaeraceae bacterium]
MSFAQSRRATTRGIVPLAAMIDVMFLLLIFFTTTSTFRAREQQMDVKLPVAQHAKAQEATRTEVVVNVRHDGVIVVADKVYPLKQLRAMLAELVKAYPDERLIIRGDQTTQYGRIIAVMDAARSAGVGDIRFATVKNAGEVERGNDE